VKLSEDQYVRYYAWIEHTVAGPYTVEGLESLVYLQKVRADTLICREGSETYTRLLDSELGPVLFPQGRPENKPQNWAPPGQEHSAAHLNRKRYQLTEASFEKVNAAPGQEPRIDVYNILGEIRQSEIESGRDWVRTNRFKISKRSIDFWIMIIAGNGLLLAGIIYFNNPITLVFGLGGSGLYTFGLIWCMFGVMDRY
jgi:hypothetical protein